MNTERYFYTIIIPHYNIPKLLRRCLSSIPKRDDLQIIVVDDKSSDGNIQRLKALETEYSYVTFIYSETNGGGGKARNLGLEHAVGKYVLFADGDDFFNYCIIDILDEYKNQDWDAVYFNANHIDTETYLSTKRSTTLQRALRMYAKDGSLDAFRFAFGEPWCKLVKREIIEENGIRFDELPIHNDTKFSYLTGFHAQQVKFDNRALYCLADRSGSVSKKPNDEKLIIRMRVFAEKNRFLLDHGVSYYDVLMTSPLWIFLVRGDKDNFRRCFSIAKEYGFSNAFVFRKLARKFCSTISRDIKKSVKCVFHIPR